MSESVAFIFILSVIRLSAPMFIAGTGNMYCERVGVLNLGAEGMMVSGAFAAVLGSYLTGSPWIGVLFGMGAGLLAGGVHALVCVEFGGMHAISGLGLTMLCNGIARFLCISIFGSTYSPNVKALQTTEILSGIPFIGRFLSRTPYGLRVQAVGDDPKTVETAGISVWRLRYSGVLICGALCGIAGAYMSLGQLDRFFDGMISGKGMMAVIAVKMGKWAPGGILGTALLLGLFDALQMRLQVSNALGLSPELLGMVPYLAGIAVLCFQKSKNARPAALDTAYLRNRYKF